MTRPGGDPRFDSAVGLSLGRRAIHRTMPKSLVPLVVEPDHPDHGTWTIRVGNNEVLIHSLPNKQNAIDEAPPGGGAVNYSRESKQDAVRQIRTR